MSERITSLADIEDVEIDDFGRFKYILIKASLNDQHKFLVRGFAWASYHADIFDLFESSKSPIKYECVGGGRIEVEPHNKKIKIFGYSQGFGRADHEMSCDLVRKKYKDYEKSLCIHLELLPST
ncbi:14 kDa phosphohistidine phosphatase [Sarcoptes scabiei]|nr:14 kDa phosphohistidine phosphatase [Sarcoptes scabiei]